MFGSVYPWAYSILEWIIALMMGAWLINLHILKLEPSPGVPNRRLLLPAFLFLTLLALQLISFPPKVLKILSPRTAELYSFCLSDLKAGSDTTYKEGSPVNKSPFQESGQSKPNPSSLSIYRHPTRAQALQWMSYFALLYLLINYRPEGTAHVFLSRMVIVICIAAGSVTIIALMQKVLGANEIYGFWKPLHQSKTVFMGPYINANHFAGYLEMTIPLFISLYSAWIGSLKRPSSPRMSKLLEQIQSPEYNKAVLGLIVILLLISSLFMSLSRAGIASLIVSLLLSLCIFCLSEKRFRPENWQRVRKAVFGVSFIVFMFLTVVTATVVLFKMETSGASNISEAARFKVWRDTWRMFRDFPLWGIGLGSFSYLYPHYKTHQVSFLFTHVENDYLQLLVETGIVGFGLIVWFFAGFLVEIWRNLNWQIQVFRERSNSTDPATHTRRTLRYTRTKENELQTLARYPLPRENYYLLFGCIASILVMAFHSVADFNLHIPANALLFFVVLGLTFRLTRLNRALSIVSKGKRRTS